jgi:hypothetical protein
LKGHTKAVMAVDFDKSGGMLGMSRFHLSRSPLGLGDN